MSYIKHEQEGSTFNSVEFTLKPVDLPDKLNVLVKALCCHFHPFFDYKRGWVSLDPPSTREFYGLTCDVLRVADTVAVTPPAERPEASSSWTMMDTSATNILAEWAARVCYISLNQLNQYLIKCSLN
jgi:Ataxin-1 and HBP1 module (AXH)